MLLKVHHEGFKFKLKQHDCSKPSLVLVIIELSHLILSPKNVNEKYGLKRLTSILGSSLCFI